MLKFWKSVKIWQTHRKFKGWHGAYTSVEMLSHMLWIALLNSGRLYHTNVGVQGVDPKIVGRRMVEIQGQEWCRSSRAKSPESWILCIPGLLILHAISHINVLNMRESQSTCYAYKCEGSASPHAPGSHLPMFMSGWVVKYQMLMYFNSCLT